MYSRARAYTCYARGRSERKEKNTSTYTTRVSPSLRVRGRNEASNVRAMRPDNRRKRNGGTREEERAEYRLRNSASSRFYRFTWTRTMGERSLLINAHSFLLFFLSFPFFFYSARHVLREEEYVIPSYRSRYHCVCERSGEIIGEKKYISSSRGRDPNRTVFRV